MSFVHLHTHSEFSLLDGANRLRDLVHRAKHFEMPAMALTDHGCMFGAWQFQKQARADGLKPIIGMEAYVAPGDRRDRTRSESGGKNYFHLVMMARDRVGYQNLVKLSSLGYTEGFYFKPRIDREIMREYSEGIIVSSACLAGEIAQNLMKDDWDAAREAAAWHADVFRDRYYLEVQGHDSPGQDELNRKILQLGEETGIPVVATNDAHFLEASDHSAHDVLCCIGMGKDRDDPNRLIYDEGLYFKNHEEMHERFPDNPEVVENTLGIGDEVDWTFDKKYHVPEFPLPEEFIVEGRPMVDNENAYLDHLAREGARERYGTPLSQEVRDRLEYELEVIKGTGYAGYFLITADFIQWARDHDIPVGPGRGSAAGSLVAYSTGITNLDPLEFDLLFERFLNPERVSMPDVDIDFCYERRQEVIEYTRDKYGKDAVGQIITFGTMKARAVVKDVGRVLGFEPGETDKIAKLIPNDPGQSFTVAEAVQKLKDVKKLYKQDERHKQLFDYSMTLEGLSRHTSVHAAGVVIAPGPIDDYVPVCVQTGKAAQDDDAMVVTQYDMNSLEEAGMLKMDFLGLKTLTVLYDAVEAVKARMGELRHPVSGDVYADMDDVPLDDPAVYEMLARGGTSGVFQFESSLATDKLRAMRCDRFEDLVATNALIRPGPLDAGMTDVYIERKLGREPVAFAHPDLEETLDPTYGIIVYQEQVMRIANVLAEFSLGEADVLRKAVGKKNAELIARELGKFTERAIANGVDKKTATDLAEQIETFGRYGFNKSHSAAYSLISYHTAWLKAHYPAEFMAGLLSSVLDKTDDVVKYIAECKELQRYLPELESGIEVLPPDVNESGWKFTAIAGTQVRFGLGAVRGVGSSAVRSILDARTSGPFTSLFDFLTRIDTRALNKRACEALVCAGALDAFGSRSALLAGLDTAYAEVQAREAEEAAGQENLFGGGTPGLEREDPKLPTVPDWDEADRLKREKESIGFYISGHPLDRFRDVVGAFDTVNTRALQEHAGRKVELACVVTNVARQISRRDNSEWGKVTVEDFHGTASVLAFKDIWQDSKEALVEDAVVLLRGQVSDRDRDSEDPPVFLDGVQALEELPGSGALAVQIELPIGAELAPEVFAHAKDILASHPGPTAVELTLGADNGAPAPRFRSRSLRVDPMNGTLPALRELFGAGRVRLVRVGGISAEPPPGFMAP